MLLTKQANINCRPSGGAPDHTGRIIYYDTPLSRCCGRGSERAAAFYSPKAPTSSWAARSRSPPRTATSRSSGRFWNTRRRSTPWTRGSPRSPRRRRKDVSRSYSRFWRTPRRSQPGRYRRASAQGGVRPRCCRRRRHATRERRRRRAVRERAYAAARRDRHRPARRGAYLLCDHGAKMSWERAPKTALALVLVKTGTGWRRRTP